MAQGVDLSGLTCPQCRWEPVLGTLCLGGHPVPDLQGGGVEGISVARRTGGRPERRLKLARNTPGLVGQPGEDGAEVVPEQ